MKQGFDTLQIGKGETVRPGRDVAIVAIGNMVASTMKAADLLAKDGIEAEVVNMRFVQPIDEELLKGLCARFSYILTVEDHVMSGGFGSAILETLVRNDVHDVHVKLHGIPGEFVEHGTPAELHAMLKLDAPGIASVVKNFFRNQSNPASVKTLA
jgi:1-deoxy-D-xylulose-5-phosphate synthase